MKTTKSQDRQINMTLRIAELIKAANTNEPIALAAFLVKHGVCDATEVIKQTKKEILLHQIIWH